MEEARPPQRCIKRRARESAGLQTPVAPATQSECHVTHYGADLVSAIDPLRADRRDIGLGQMHQECPDRLAISPAPVLVPAIFVPRIVIEAIGVHLPRPKQFEATGRGRCLGATYIVLDGGVVLALNAPGARGRVATKMKHIEHRVSDRTGIAEG